MGQIEVMPLKLCPPFPASSQEFSKFYDEPMGKISFQYQSNYTNHVPLGPKSFHWV